MKIEVDLNRLKRNHLSPNQYIVLYLIYYKHLNILKKLFTYKEALLIRDSLVGTKYILSKSDVKFKNTILSVPNICKLFNIRADEINFAEFYGVYPIKVGSRILRARSVDTILGQKHQRKYLLKVNTIAAHKDAIIALEAYIAKQRISGNLKYLLNIETILNNAMWEQWEEFVTPTGKENANWQDDTI